MIEPLYRARKWMKFAGVLSIIQGVIQMISLWGILICWIPIWMGAALLSATNCVTRAYETDSEDEFTTAMQKLATYFRIFGIMALLLLIVAAGGIVMAVLLPALVGTGS